MTWLQLYRLKRAYRSSLWLMPSLAIAFALVVALLLRRIDHATNYGGLHFSADGARTILAAFTTSMLTLIVFVVSSLLIVVQLASAQLTPRMIAGVFNRRQLRWVLSFFTFTYAFTIAASGRIEESTPQLSVAFAIACNLVCIAVFFWFGQWLGSSLRPVAVLQSVADQGRAVMEGVYPQPFDPSAEKPVSSPALQADTVIVEHSGHSGVVLAFSRHGLSLIAENANAVIELVPQVGDFVARGDPLFRVHSNGGSINASSLLACIAIGPERTIEQDPRFAIRIMVDIANKALSPAINDPTTAVLVLDQLHRLLMYVGQRRLDAGETHDAHGRLRLRYGTPDWVDFVNLGITEIRLFGGGSMQVARRLQAMIEHLLQVLPQARKAALQQELALLQLATQRFFPDEVDRARARVSDLQGIGSSEPSDHP